MRTTARGLSAIVVLAIGSLALAAQDAARPPRDIGRPASPAETSTAVIRGRVTTADGGAPIRRAEVAALSSAFDSRTTFTDDDGRFELAGLPAGTWYLSMAKLGYLTQPFGARRYFEAARAVTLDVGQQFSADVAMTRASAITGRVYDQSGEPITGVRVSVLRARMAQGRRHLQPVGAGDITDDTGGFRLHSLPPGEYYVTGSLRLAPADSIVQTTYSPTYYPGTGSFAEAQRVLLAPGTEAVVDFPLLPFLTARVSGMVVSSSGSPASAFLNLTSEAGELGVPLGIGGVTREDGTFTLADVPPGTYTLVATLREGTNTGAEAATVPLAVYGDDVSGVALVTSKPGSLRGTIVAAAGVTRPLPSAIDVVARSTRTGGESTFGEVDDGSFELTVPPGPFRLHVDVPEEWSVKSISVRNSDGTDAPIDIGSEQQVPVQVVLTDRITEVSGTITGADPGQPPSVVVFPEDAGRWEQADRYVRAVAAGEKGRFRVTGLPAGTRYLAIAVDTLEDGEGEDPEFLSRVKDYAVSFGLAEGDKHVIAVPLMRR